MSIPDGLVEVLVGLKTKTVEGKATWTGTEYPDQFAVVFKSGILILDYSNTLEAFKVYLVTVASTEGARLQTYNFEYGNYGYQVVADLYDMAKNSYFGIDRILGAMRSELEDEIVGSETSAVAARDIDEYDPFAEA